MLYLGWTYISSGGEVANKWLDGYMIELILSMDARIFNNSYGSCSVFGVVQLFWCRFSFIVSEGVLPGLNSRKSALQNLARCLPVPKATQENIFLYHMILAAFKVPASMSRFALLVVSLFQMVFQMLLGQYDSSI